MIRGISAVLPKVIESWASASSLVSMKANEDAAKVGCNTSAAVCMQFCQMAALHDQFSALLSASHKTHRPNLTVPLIFLIPISIGYLKHKIPNGSAKKIVGRLHDNLGSLCHIASIAVSIALLHLGHKTRAVTSLTLLSFGYLSRRNYFPVSVRQSYRYIDAWVEPIGSLLYGNWVFKLLTLVEGYGSLYSFLSGAKQVAYDKASDSSQLLNWDQYESLVTRKGSGLQVNRDHVQIAPFPSFPPADTNSLIAFCNAFVWDQERLSREIDKDARWSACGQKALHDQEASKQGQQALQIAYAKSQFKTLVESVQNESIQTGEILNYGVLKNYLGCIAAKLPLASKEIQDQIMIQLSVEGGDYCGPGVYYQLEMGAQTLLVNLPQGNLGPQRLPLKQRILLFLQQERMKIIQGLHVAISSVDPSYKILFGNTADTHAQNYTINLLASHFGLPDQGASQDRIAQVSKLDAGLKQLSYRISSETPWTGIDEEKLSRLKPVWGYTADYIVQALWSQIGTALFPKAEIYEWLQDWSRAHLDAEKQKIIVNSCEEGSFECRADDTGADPRSYLMPPLIEAMLVDMGILQEL